MSTMTRTSIDNPCPLSEGECDEAVKDNGVLHMVYVKVEGCEPQRTDKIVRACQSQWKMKRHRDEMVRVDKNTPETQASLSIFVWVYFPFDIVFDEENGFVDRLAFAVWKANGGYCFVEVLPRRECRNETETFYFFDTYYEAVLTYKGKGADKARKLAGMA